MSRDWSVRAPGDAQPVYSKCFVISVSIAVFSLHLVLIDFFLLLRASVSTATD